MAPPSTPTTPARTALMDRQPISSPPFLKPSPPDSQSSASTPLQSITLSVFFTENGFPSRLPLGRRTEADTCVDQTEGDRKAGQKRWRTKLSYLFKVNSSREIKVTDWRCFVQRCCEQESWRLNVKVIKESFINKSWWCRKCSFFQFLYHSPFFFWEVYEYRSLTGSLKILSGRVDTPGSSCSFIYAASNPKERKEVHSSIFSEIWALMVLQVW